MKKTLAILLAAIFMIMACAESVYADDDEGDEADENEAGEENSGDDEKENSVPGFEFAFAAGAAIAAARLIKARLL
jgi:protein involved in sex pheromone biosynthesis